MHCDFLRSDGLQETHMDASKPFNSKQLTLKMRGGFFTKFATLAHGGAPDYGHQLRQKAFVLSRRVLRTYYVVSDPQINFAKPAEN